MKELRQKALIMSWGALSVFAAGVHTSIICVHALTGNLEWGQAIPSFIGSWVLAGLMIVVYDSRVFLWQGHIPLSLVDRYRRHCREDGESFTVEVDIESEREED